MKKKIKYFLLVLTLLFVSCGQKATTYEAKEALSKHLVERYGEEFEIGYIGRRSDGDDDIWYQAEIYPSKYVGTPKERDKYYRRSGTVNIKKGILGEKLGFVGDTYGIVKMNESAEEFYGKKLKELFGDNVLQVYDIRFNRILEDYSFEKIIKVWKEEGVRLTIKGGIYIFGRVENDEDREWYRTQIYEFIQFMKETGTFEYVSMQIKILDERCLTNYFDENKEVLRKSQQKYKTSKEYLKFKEKFFLEAEVELKKTTNKEKLKKINNFKKSDFLDFSNSSYFALYHVGLVSPKFKDIEPRDNSKRKNYNSIDDVKLLNTTKIIYNEYERKKDGEIVEY